MSTTLSVYATLGQALTFVESCAFSYIGNIVQGRKERLLLQSNQKGQPRPVPKQFPSMPCLFAFLWIVVLDANVYCRVNIQRPLLLARPLNGCIGS
ncbi:hypothetical protein BDW68DRAFT_153308 [Aspergillus falconensis]